MFPLASPQMAVIAETADRVAVMYAGRVAEIGPVREVVQRPFHPYSRGLMGSIPTLEGAADRLVQIPGSMPRLASMPRGCAFHPRCSFAFARCHLERPEPVARAEHQVACFLFEEGLEYKILGENAAPRPSPNHTAPSGASGAPSS